MVQGPQSLFRVFHREDHVHTVDPKWKKEKCEVKKEKRRHKTHVLHIFSSLISSFHFYSFLIYASFTPVFASEVPSGVQQWIVRAKCNRRISQVVCAFSPFGAEVAHRVCCRSKLSNGRRRTEEERPWLSLCAFWCRQSIVKNLRSKVLWGNWCYKTHSCRQLQTYWRSPHCSEVRPSKQLCVPWKKREKKRRTSIMSK